MDVESGGRLPLVVCLYGPTATGKTDIAVELVQSLPSEIISVDSALIYRGMDIGTAKPDASVLAKAPHRLVDICDPRESYSAARFREDALAAIEEIHSRGKIPLLVGGTLLYFRALMDGLSPLPASDPAVRAALEERLQTQGLERLHAELARVDAAAAERIHPTDPQRILRALEVYEITKTPISILQKQKMPSLGDSCKVLSYGLFPAERSRLHARIEQRFDAMMANGFLEEVEGLMQLEGIHESLPSMRCVGYRQAWEHLTGGTSYDEMVSKSVVATRQLAKRQITWMRSTGADRMFDPYEQPLESIAQEIGLGMAKYVESAS